MVRKKNFDVLSLGWSMEFKLDLVQIWQSVWQMLLVSVVAINKRYKNVHFFDKYSIISDKIIWISENKQMYINVSAVIKNNIIKHYNFLVIFVKIFKISFYK